MSSRMPPLEPQRGFALAALMAVVAVLTIMVTVTEPVRRVQAQRALEEELIFRGEEYVRAIQKYQRRFGIYPPDVDALLETNGVRFLRRAYTDPITGEDFRLLTLNPDGTINGATVFSEDPAARSLFPGGNPPVLGAEPGRGGGGGGTRVLFSLQPAQGSPGAPPGFSLTPFSAGFTVAVAQGGGAPIAVSGLVGVAPASEAESLKLYKDRGIYREWEFIALPGPGGIPGAGNVIPAPQESGGSNP